MLCDSCINQLIKSYEFMMKIHSAEDRLQTFELNLKNQTENSENNIEMEYLIEEVDADNNELIQAQNNCSSSIVESHDDVVEILIENSNIDESNVIIEQDVNEYEIIKTVKNPKSPKKRKIEKKSISEKPANGKFCLAIPRFVIKNQPSAIETDYYESNTVKIMDVEPVEVQYDDLQNITKDMEFIVEEADVDVNLQNSTNNIIYSCKYCPKAYSTVNHLILHTRKCHLCQFCLKGFEKTCDLFSHNHEMHSNFYCYICSKYFTKNSSLRAHLTRSHDISLPANVSLLSI